MFDRSKIGQEDSGSRMLKQHVRNELLAGVRLSDREQEARCKDALSLDYWRRLCPQASIGSPDLPIETAISNHQSVENAVNQLRTRGYFNSGPLISQATVALMRECIEAVRNAGWPPVFAFVYDPFWAVTRTPYVVQFLSAVLGSEFNVIMSRVWCYYIAPVRGAAGWPPHADDYRRHQNRLTLWIPVTHATLDNGCMYVVPKDFIYGNRAPAKERLRSASIAGEYCLKLLQDCRALPAAAGSILGWEPQTIHWGSKCHEPTEPRISIGCEFASEGVTPRPHGSDELWPGQPEEPLPGFVQRIRHVALSIRIHHGRDLKAGKFAELAEMLIGSTEPPAR
jgi:hypothetical protein